MNERVRIALFVFLLSISLYVVKGIITSVDFKRVPITPAKVSLPAPYGAIVGSDGEAVSQNILAYDVYIDVGYAKELSGIQGWKYPDRVIEAVRYFGLNPQSGTISKIINSSKGGIQVGIVDSKKASSIPNSFKDFMNIQNVYVHSRVATSLSILTKAIQNSYSSYLKPKSDGEITYNALGPYAFSSGIKKFVDPVGGDSIMTTIDPRIQSFAQKAIDDAVLTNAASGGQIVVMNPNTGAVVAMASTWQWNAPVMNVFEPGSTMKPLVFSAALQEGVVSTKTTFSTPYFIPSPDLSLVIKDAEVHPWPITLRKALVYSSDVAEMTIADDLINKIGKTGFYDWFLKFGFGKKTGIDLPDEIDGIILPTDQWYALGGVEMSIGQGIAVTAIQLSTALNAVVNGGFITKPHVINEIVTPSGSIAYSYDPEKKRIFDSNVTRIVRSFMVDVVKEGTGKPAQLPGVLVGGKTGTAEKPIDGKVSRKGPFFSLFYGFFPADNPKYSILVVVDQPSKGKYYGEDVAAPVFHKVGEYILGLEGRNQNPVSRDMFSPVSMPNLKGLTLNESLSLLNSLSFPASKVDFSGNGIVTWQSPSPETPILDVKRVKLLLGPAF